MTTSPLPPMPALPDLSAATMTVLENLLIATRPDTKRPRSRQPQAAPATDQKTLLHNAGSTAHEIPTETVAGETIAHFGRDAPLVPTSAVESRWQRITLGAMEGALALLTIALTVKSFEVVPLGATTARLLSILATVIAITTLIKVPHHRGKRTTWLPPLALGVCLGCAFINTTAHRWLVAASHPGALGIRAGAITAITPALWALMAHSAARTAMKTPNP